MDKKTSTALSAIERLRKKGVTELEISKVFSSEEFKVFFPENCHPPYWGVIPGKDGIPEEPPENDYELGNEVAAFIVDYKN